MVVINSQVFSIYIVLSHFPLHCAMSFISPRWNLFILLGLEGIIYTVSYHTLILVQICQLCQKKNKINVFIYVILEKACCSLNQCLALLANNT